MSLENALRKVEHPLGDLFYSPEILVEERKGYREMMGDDADDDFDHSFETISFDQNLDMMLGAKDGYKNLIEEYAKKLNLSGTAVLLAHGGPQNGQWMYESSGKFWRVQDWINKVDGDYKLLVITVCNEGADSIKSKRSAVLVPNGVYSGINQMQGDVQTELFLPGTGYVSSYEA